MASDSSCGDFEGFLRDENESNQPTLNTFNESDIVDEVDNADTITDEFESPTCRNCLNTFTSVTTTCMPPHGQPNFDRLSKASSVTEVNCMLAIIKPWALFQWITKEN